MNTTTMKAQDPAVIKMLVIQLSREATFKNRKIANGNPSRKPSHHIARKKPKIQAMILTERLRTKAAFMGELVISSVIAFFCGCLSSFTKLTNASVRTGTKNAIGKILALDGQAQAFHKAKAKKTTIARLKSAPQLNAQ
jgi:hypothetical protein